MAEWQKKDGVDQRCCLFYGNIWSDPDPTDVEMRIMVKETMKRAQQDNDQR